MDDPELPAPAEAMPLRVPLVGDGFTEIDAYKGNSRWVSRGEYFYIACRTRGASTSFRCASDRCPAHWIMRDAQVPGPVVGEHDHEPTPWVPNRNTLFQVLKRRAAEENGALNAIYEEEAARYPDGASRLLFESIVSSMRKWRKATQPAIPHTLPEYALALSGHRQLNGILLATVSVANSTAVILVMPGFERCIGDSDMLVVDATFLTVPAGLPVQQILTMHAVIEGHNFHPVVVLMENRRRMLYEAVFQRVWQAAGNPRPGHIVTDFEQALRFALTSVTGVTTQGCFFHYMQALMRRAQQMGMLVQRRDSPGWRLVRLYATLAFLPPAQVPLGLAEVEPIARTENLPFNPDFHAYFVTQWMTRVGPAGFSVHGALHRTSNIAESFHAGLKRSLGPSPNVWRFSDIIRQKFEVSRARLEAQRRGDLPRRNRERYYVRAALLANNGRALERGLISVREYLSQTSRRIDVGDLVAGHDVPEPAEEVVIDDALDDNQDDINDDGLGQLEPEGALIVEVPLLAPNRPAPAQGPRCPVCLENEPQVVAIPCGHMICQICRQGMLAVADPDIRNDICPVCRADIISVNRIYF